MKEYDGVSQIIDTDNCTVCKIIMDDYSSALSNLVLASDALYPWFLDNGGAKIGYQ